MYKFFTFLLICLFSTSVFADWQIETFQHSATKTQVKSAMIRNPDGFELAIFQTSEGIVWMDFSLSDNTFDELAQRPLPLFQIDNRKPVQLLRGFTATIVPEDEGIEAIVVDDQKSITTKRDFSVNHIIAERLPERVICPIWQGDSRPHLGTLAALVDGKQIKFDYTLSDGTKGKTSFTLQGANLAINSLITK
ncbi:MAG: hypothetical protein COC04_00370 [Gammaproteobacteria bacterium]|nr:MAG: hypothetical protein COC04_00370 [Gammaproteobacteria bacterium]